MVISYTIGHGTRSLPELGAVLSEAKVTRLVDVRRWPASRRNPQLSRASLEAALPQQGIAYDFRGDGLGGRRSGVTGQSRHPAWRVAAFRNYADYMDTSEFESALDRLERDIERDRLCLMCAETLWWRCHRRLIADALVMKGHSVVHLIGLGQSQTHQLHEAARPDERGLPVYDGGHTGRLSL